MTSVIGSPRKSEGAMPSSSLAAASWPTECTRVVIVTGRSPGRGGVETVVSNLAGMFDDGGVAVEVVSVFAGRGVPAARTTTLFPRRGQLQERSITAGRRGVLGLLRALPLLALKRWDILAARRRLHRVVAPLGAETVIIATGPSAAAHLPRRLRGARPGDRPTVVVQYHIPFEAQERLEGEGLPLSRSLDVDGFVALSHDDATKFARVLGRACARIPNPLAAPARVATPVRGEAQHVDEQRSVKTVMSLSRLSSEKQLDRMITDFVQATADPTLSDWRLKVYGDGDQRAHLEELIAGTPGGDRVTLMGWTEDSAAVLSEARLLLSTSAFEAFGMNVLEAAQQGTPTLAFACSPGLRDLVGEMGGVLVEPDDDQAFVSRLAGLLAAPETLQAMGAEARARAASYSHDSIRMQWAQVIRTMPQARIQTPRKAPST